MTFREITYLLLGTGLGSAVTLLLRKIVGGIGGVGSPGAPLPREAQDEPPLQPQQGTSETPSSVMPQSSIASEQVEVEVSPTRFRIKGTIRGILTVAALVLLSLFGWLAVRGHSRRNGDPEDSPAPASMSAEELYSKMQRGVAEKRYSVQPYPGKEVVSGLVGRYYYVDLKRADAQKTLFFGPAEYVQNEFSTDFRESMKAFSDDILRHIRVRHQIFVRGSADKSGDDAPVLKELIEGDSKLIYYLPTMPGNPNQYSSKEEVQVVPKGYANRHLPNLRAAYVQEKLSALDFPATILQGLVTAQANEQDRYATMLLYVNWPKNLLARRP